MSRNFVIWSNRYTEGHCVIEGPEGVPDAYRLNKGVPVSKGWPTKAICRMSNDFPKDLELVDNLYGSRFVVISKALRDELVGAGVQNVEFLPVQIHNHKKRLASADYFLLNPPETIDCIDIAASGVTWNSINPELISTCKKMVLKVASIPDTTRVLRPKHAPSVILVDATLSKQLTKAKLTGLQFNDPLKFKRA